MRLHNGMKRFRASLQEDSILDAEFNAIKESVKQIPQIDTNAILAILQEQIPNVVQTLVGQQAAKIKRNLMHEINIMSANVSDMLERREYLLNLEAESSDVRKKNERS